MSDAAQPSPVAVVPAAVPVAPHDAAPAATGAPAEGAPHAAAQKDDGHKVFAGNLPFSTTNAELKDFFAGHPVVSASVIHRGPRSLGYGFVTFAHEADAEAAVKALDKAELGGREVNVEVAKHKVFDPSAPHPAPRAPRGGFRGPRGAAHANGAPVLAGNAYARPVNGTGLDTADPVAFAQSQAAAAQHVHPAPHRGRGGYRGGRGRGGKRGGAHVEGDHHVEAAVPAVIVEPAAPAAVAEGEHAAQSRAGRGRGGRRPSARPIGAVSSTAELSTTTLFVANVPFRFEDADLMGVFTAKGYAVASAHVVKMRNGRSKGFGFVECGEGGVQAKILQECPTIQAAGRDLVVRAALANQVHHTGEHEHEEHHEVVEAVHA